MAKRNFLILSASILIIALIKDYVGREIVQASWHKIIRVSLVMLFTAVAFTVLIEWIEPYLSEQISHYVRGAKSKNRKYGEITAYVVLYGVLFFVYWIWLF